MQENRQKRQSNYYRKNKRINHYCWRRKHCSDFIENDVKKNLEFVSNCMIIGDNRKYLSILLTLKQDQTSKGKLDPEVISEFNAQGSSATTIEEAKLDPLITKYIQSLIDKTNQQVISKSQHIRKWTVRFQY